MHRPEQWDRVGHGGPCDDRGVLAHLPNMSSTFCSSPCRAEKYSCFGWKRSFLGLWREHGSAVSTAPLPHTFTRTHTHARMHVHTHTHTHHLQAREVWVRPLCPAFKVKDATSTRHLTIKTLKTHDHLLHLHMGTVPEASAFHTGHRGTPEVVGQGIPPSYTHPAQVESGPNEGTGHPIVTVRPGSETRLEAKREPWGLGTMSHNTTTQEQDRTLMLQGGATQPGCSPDHKTLCAGSPARRVTCAAGHPCGHGSGAPGPPADSQVVQARPRGCLLQTRPHRRAASEQWRPSGPEVRALAGSVWEASPASGTTLTMPSGGVPRQAATGFHGFQTNEEVCQQPSERLQRRLGAPAPRGSTWRAHVASVRTDAG